MLSKGEAQMVTSSYTGLRVMSSIAAVAFFKILTVFIQLKIEKKKPIRYIRNMMYFHQHYHLNVTRTFLSKPLAKVCISDQHPIFILLRPPTALMIRRAETFNNRKSPPFDSGPTTLNDPIIPKTQCWLQSGGILGFTLLKRLTGLIGTKYLVAVLAHLGQTSGVRQFRR